jgi:competence protein ComGC
MNLGPFSFDWSQEDSFTLIVVLLLIVVLAVIIFKVI